MKKIFLIITMLIAGLWVFSLVHKSPAEINSENSDKVQIGMTTSDVEAIMGKPREVNTTYACASGYGYLYDNVFGSSDNVRFCFTEGKVSYISRE